MTANTVLSGKIPVDAFMHAFPFFFAWDDSNVIVELGPSLQKLCGHVYPGARVQDVFALKRPAGELTFSFAEKNAGELFLIVDRVNQRTLRGSVMPLPDQHLMVMLATPWLADTNQMIEYGLSLRDFAPQDQTIDLLQLLQSQDMATADLRRLNEVLREKRRELQEQQAQLEKLALVVSRTDNAVVITSRTGRIEWVNDAFTRITGYRSEEVLGRKPGEFLQGPETDPSIVRTMSEHLQEKRGFIVEVINYHKDGSKYWVSIEVQPILSAGGEVTNFVAIERDITERKQNQESLERYRVHLEELVEARTQELTQNQLLLEAIVKTNPNGVLLVDNAGVIRMANQALEQIFGYGYRELIGRELEVLIPAGRRDSHVCMRRQFMTTEASRQMGAGGELLGQRKDGLTFPVEIALASFTVHDERFVQATVVDVTERKEAAMALHALNQSLEEKVALRTEELLAASAAKSKFLAHMSHEIRTPMNGILGLAQLLERTSLQLDQYEMVRRIRQAGTSLMEILNDILDFSKIEAGGLRIEAEPFELGRYCRNSTACWAPMLEIREQNYILMRKILLRVR